MNLLNEPNLAALIALDEYIRTNIVKITKMSNVHLSVLK